ncbi:DUF7249 family protein [Cloacibacillus porcorum]
MTEKYNGWKNCATWNVALWINNDEGLYRAAVEFMQTYKGKRPYAAFVKEMFMPNERTPDGYKWHDKALGYEELDDMMRELID